MLRDILGPRSVWEVGGVGHLWGPPPPLGAREKREKKERGPGTPPCRASDVRRLVRRFRHIFRRFDTPDAGRPASGVWSDLWPDLPAFARQSDSGSKSLWRKERFLERWSHAVGASDTTIKEAFLRQGSCPPTPIQVRPDSTLGSSLALEAEEEPALFAVSHQPQPAVAGQPRGNSGARVPPATRSGSCCGTSSVRGLSGKLVGR